MKHPNIHECPSFTFDKRCYRSHVREGVSGRRILQVLNNLRNPASQTTFSLTLLLRLVENTMFVTSAKPHPDLTVCPSIIFVAFGSSSVRGLKADQGKFSAWKLDFKHGPAAV